MSALDSEGPTVPRRPGTPRTIRMKRAPQGTVAASLTFGRDGLTKELVGETINVTGEPLAYTHIPGADPIFFVRSRSSPSSRGAYKPTPVYISMVNATTEDHRDLRAVLAYSRETNSSLGIEGVVEKYDSKRRLGIKHIVSAQRIKCQSLIYKVKDNQPKPKP